MSTQDEIERHIARLLGETPPRLFFLPSAMRSQKASRRVFVSREVHYAVQPKEFAQTQEGLWKQKLRGQLDAFSEGKIFSVSEKPRDKDSSTMLARTEPPQYEVWDHRVIAPKPGLRCFGRFGGKNVFIALTWNYRRNIRNDDWTPEINRCRDEWMNLFGLCPIFAGRHLDEYLTDYFVSD